MGRLKAKSDYESLRNARIQENQARLASLGVQKTISDLRSLVSSAKAKSKSEKKKWQISPKKLDNYHITPLRRSNRLSAKSSEESAIPNANANAPLVKTYNKSRKQVPARRIGGKVYHPVFGICCHFCRQKTLCSEEGCKRCGNFDVNQPCIGKTDCSVCHSTNGVLCRACLKVRYGEELEEVRENKEWMCPHCIEAKGIRPYWICNSSFCLKNRKMAPTGIAIFRARELGYESVAHLLMDELQRKDPSRLRCSSK